jgi:hypothetical protein
MVMKVEVGQKFKVVKDVYYVSEDSSLECEFLTKEELMDQIAHVCVKDDVYEVVEEKGIIYFDCISGQWEGESNDGWFDWEEMIDKNIFEEVK